MTIAVVPAVTPVTTPDVLDAIVTFELAVLHVPPPASVNVVVPPVHTFRFPLIALTVDATVALVVYVALHPEPAPSFTATEYTPVAAIVAPGTVAVAAAGVVIDTGPVHK